MFLHSISFSREILGIGLQCNFQVSEKRRKYKKYAIIAGSAVLVVAIVLTAILVGLYFFSETQKDIIKVE